MRTACVVAASCLLMLAALAPVPNGSGVLLLAEAVPKGGTTAPVVPASRPGQLSADVTVQRDIEYVPGGGKSRTLDLYLPP